MKAASNQTDPAVLLQGLLKMSLFKLNDRVKVVFTLIKVWRLARGEPEVRNGSSRRVRRVGTLLAHTHHPLPV